MNVTLIDALLVSMSHSYWTLAHEALTMTIYNVEVKY
jgi:hypothetical protein